MIQLSPTTHSKYPQISVDEALERLLSHLEPLAPRTTDLAGVLGSVLSADVLAPGPMPPFSASAKDGYAVRSDDTPGRLAVIGDAAAGRAFDGTLGRGEAVRIATGAPLPAGADAVVMVEHTEPAGDHVEVKAHVRSEADVRPVGIDYAAGDLVLPAGTAVGPAETGLLASVGAIKVQAFPRPRVAVISSGEEVVPPDTHPGPGQIRDANRPALTAAVRRDGGDVTWSDHIGDSESATERLAEAVASVDIVITAGGVSMGERDRIKPWLEANGEVVFGRVRTKPGKPMTFARVNGTPVMALPGFPVSALVCYEVFVRPCLRRLAGHPDVHYPSRTVTAGHDLEHDPDRVEFQRAKVVLEAGRPMAYVTGPQGSGRLLSFVGANALLRLPRGAGHTPAGSDVHCLLLGAIGELQP